MSNSRRKSGGSSGCFSCSTKAAVCAASNGLGTMPTCSRSSTWACVFWGVGDPCFCRVDGASPAPVDGVPFSTVRFWEVGRYSSSLSARRRRAGSSGRPRPRARQYRTTERCKTPSSVHWISPNRHRGTRTGAVLSAQVVVRRAQRALRYVSTSFSRRCRQRSCVFAASSSLAKTRGTSFFFAGSGGEKRPLSLDDERRRTFQALKQDGC